LALAAPLPQRSGYAPSGATGVYQALLKRAPLSAADHRGFEVRGYDRYGGGFDSCRCHAFGRDFAALGAEYNQWGLIVEESQADRCAAFANGPEISTCADGWHPWLVVEHAS
jgi:hypothetical protein